MSNRIESLLEDDHASLDHLLTELDSELAKSNIVRAFALLDLFWARLAVHIRAENLHLFPALANASASLFAAKQSLLTFEQVQQTLSLLRSDHDFFMKELGQMIKSAREIRAGQGAYLKEAEDLRQRLTVVRKRLENHNRLEEEQAYSWPSLLFDEQTVAQLRDRVRHELETLPPRFAA